MPITANTNAPRAIGTQPPSKTLPAVPIRKLKSTTRNTAVSGRTFASGHSQTWRATIWKANVVIAIVPAIAKTYALASAEEDLNPITSAMLVRPTSQLTIGT